MTVRIQFLKLELADFLQFRGIQSFDFATRSPTGQSSLTLITGGGGSGKTNLGVALRLALWGEEGLTDRHRTFLGWLRQHSDVRTLAYWFINADALSDGCNRAWVRLTLQIERPSGSKTAVAITRSWHMTDSGLTEYLRSKALLEGASTCLNRESIQEWICDLLSLTRRGRMFSDPEDAESLAHLVPCVPDASSSLHWSGEMHAQVRPGESWADAAPAVIGVANRLLACDAAAEPPLLLPESASEHWPGSLPVVPGVRVSRVLDSVAQADLVGSALAVGLSLIDKVRAPLILDAPTMRMRASHRTVFLEALAKVQCPQILILDHKDHIDDLVVHLWEHARRVYLAETLSPAGTRLLNADG